ncbi:MAG: hypothetical protein AB1444_01520 [Spirochaetota bacterium]
MKNFNIMLLITLLFTTGCFDFDIVHYIEPKKDKSLFIKFRVTSMYFKDQNNKNAFGNDVIKGNLPDDKNTKVTYQLIQDDITAGIEATITTKPYSTMSELDKLPLIPYQDKFGQYILLFHNYQKISSSSDFFDSQKIAEGLIAASKYRLAFGNCIPKKIVIIVNKENQEKFYPNIYQLGNIYHIDIPMNLVLMNESAVIVSFTNTINDSEISNYLAKLMEKRKEEEKKYQEELNKNGNVDDDGDENIYNEDNDTNKNQYDDNDENTDTNSNSR